MQDREVNSTPNLDETIEAIYQLYPRRVAKGAAKQAIRKALKKTTAGVLQEAVMAYAAAMQGQDRRFIPHPATWFNREQWNDDREDWQLSTAVRPASREQTRLDASGTAIAGFLASHNAGRVRESDGGVGRIETHGGPDGDAA